jgi:hypothetical protein
MSAQHSHDHSHDHSHEHSHEPDPSYTRKIAGYIFAGATTLATGILSFVGMLVFTSSLYWAVAAFFLSAAIEGQIYINTITKAIQYFFKSPKQAIIEQIKKRIRDEITEQFRKKIIAELVAKDSTFNEKDEKNKRKIDALLHKKNSAIENQYQQNFKDIEKAIEKELLDRKKEIVIKTILQILSVLFVIGAGLCAGLVSLSAADIGLATLGVSAAAINVFAPMIAVFAGVGFALMLYRNLQTIIHNDTVQKWFRKIKECFRYKNKDTDEKKDTVPRYLLRIIPFALGVGVILALATFATLATAGTWWYLAKDGALLIKGISEKAASIIRTLTCALVLLPNFIWALSNSLKTAGQITEMKFGTLKENIKKPFEKAWENKNIFAWIGALISIPLRVCIFVGHVIAMGLMSDQMPGMDPTANVALNAAAETTVDLHFIMGHDDHDDHHHHEDDHVHSNLPEILISALLWITTINLWAWIWNKMNPAPLKPEADHCVDSKMNETSHAKTNEHLPKPASGTHEKKEIPVETYTQSHSSVLGLSAQPSSLFAKNAVINNPPQPHALASSTQLVCGTNAR